MNLRNAVCRIAGILCGIFLCTCAYQADPALSGRIEAAYYNLRHDGVTSFRCKVLLVDSDRQRHLINAFLPFGDSIPEDIEYEAIVRSDGDVEAHIISTIETRNRKLKSSLGDQASAAEKILGSFLSIWKDFHFEPVSSDMDTVESIRSNAGGWTMKIVEDETRVELRISPDYRISELRDLADEQNMVVQLTWRDSPKGYLLAGCRFHDTVSAFGGEYQIEYLEIGGHYLPKRLDFAKVYDDGRRDQGTFVFSHYAFSRMEDAAVEQGDRSGLPTPAESFQLHTVAP